METGCVYGIINRLNHKIYVGSTKEFESRKKKHLWMLKREDHHNPHLQYSWDKYGERAFKVIELMRCSKDRLKELEQKFMDYYESYEKEKGYNIDRKANWSELSEREKNQKTQSRLQTCKDKSDMDKEKIKEIKHDLKYSDETYLSLSKKYNKSIGFLRRLKRGETWANVEYEGEVVIERLNYEREKDKLTKNEVKSIKRELVKGNKTQTEIAEIFNVDNSTISNINTRSIHKDVHIPEDKGGQKVSKNNFQLLDSEVVEIKKQLRDNPKKADQRIADEYDKSRSTISSIASGKTRTDIKVEGFEPTKRKTNGEPIEEE